uniref:Serpentine Receptor, class T n=1 Tax=Caenorhabditis tropicalis TaxID=1561998 RepID=A0A1I7TYK5_9PELO
MNILPFVFVLEENLGFDHPATHVDVCLHRQYTRLCIDSKSKGNDEENPSVSSSSIPEKETSLVNIINLQVLILVINLLTWTYYSRKRKYCKEEEGPFFTILFILSLTVSFRILFSIAAISLSAFIENPMSSTKVFLLQSSLYVDYCSNFFSLTITFFMSLNRCLCFVSKDWNSRIFHGIHVVYPMVFSFIISVSGAITCVLTSEIRRSFMDKLGFVDYGPNKGFRVMINRTFFLFPIGSILCYFILYYHLRQRARLVLAKSNQSRGEQKVFLQLFITTLLYMALHATYEILTLIDWHKDFSFQLLFISILGIFNCLPEMSLPLLLICSSINIKKKFWESLKKDKTQPRVTTKSSTNNV